ncbi:fatty-acyl-CoA synthase [Rhodopseudomonas thermotolerans]|uniref:Fatty-acyl-CoA synthase n=2 Tax=Rhodopseudomonas TaxID=1073 RepID=A0A336JIR5_9BRAD|nr:MULTISPECIES: acyl-CoA synthetase [Rhodopseudomonas]RED41925.1 fatty-acyl-CoA synthase [Rhodopseudomonas pentothenatexigens]REG07386.1 fatty-acyl-CoA synthase [Rhodopseudomonas thermotolerans]SSW89282.1 fatty-acyl-CoA synthase [Rhodopseudomonas pentothenatexigens]
MPILRQWAERHPDKIATRIAFGDDTINYRELDRRANAVTQLLMWMGLSAGDGIAVLLDNDLRYFELLWGARRHGVYYTPVSTHLKPEEAAYIVRDSGAKLLFVGARFGEVMRALAADNPHGCTIIVIGDEVVGGLDYARELTRFDRMIEIPDGPVGKDFFYSSGTTGKPKGIKQPLFANLRQAQASGDWVRENFGFDDDTVYLSPAPLYHGAPLRFTMRTLESGGTAVVMTKFAAEQALAAIERYRITHSQWVPTMLFRLLALPDDVRASYDLSSHACAIHAAAPCPPELKERMIAWWGPIVWEYYAGSERNGATCISSADWLSHRGSVGRACVGTIHILDEDHNELGPGEIGDVYFDGPSFVYHNDPDKTARSRNALGWSTIGDVGYLDQDGFLYLTDRRSHMIISGGVNIYPAEIENCLALHPLVADVAVFGVPNVEYGEEVKAVVQLKDPSLATPRLAQDLMAFCREQLSHVKCPRSIDFETELPRQENGKLFKHVLKRRYLQPA